MSGKAEQRWKELAALMSKARMAKTAINLVLNDLDKQVGVAYDEKIIEQHQAEHAGKKDPERAGFDRCELCSTELPPVRPRARGLDLCDECKLDGKNGAD